MIGLRMLRSAGTLDLRMNMLKTENLDFRTHRRFLNLFAILGMVLNGSVAMAEIRVSNPAGLHTIGKPIHLVSTISGIPHGAESQLRSTCLQGRIVSIESGSQSSKISSVAVNFQPTIAQGGTIEFRSLDPVNHALVRLELISECPLIVFNTGWPLIMNQREKNVDQGLESERNSQQAGVFDPASSSLLQASRKAPKFPPQIRSVAMDTAPANPATDVLEGVRKTEPTPEEAVVAEPVDNDTLKLASLDQALINHGLIESEPVSLGLHSDSGVQTPSQNESLSSLGGIEILAASTASLLILGAGWFRHRLKRNTALNVRVPLRTAEPAYKRNPIAEFSDQNISEDKPAGLLDSQHAHFGSDRVLESLMGGDEQLYAQETELAEEESMYADHDSRSNHALKKCVDMINRADVRSWELPPAYQSLVTERNKSLEMHRTPDALILRCHIGLVELAFQEAGRGHGVQMETSNELLQLLLGKHVYDLESNTTLGVPDVLKSYVKAKLCEIEGADKRQLLRENLLNLNTQVEHQALCFHTNAWREFLSEEGLLG